MPDSRPDDALVIGPVERSASAWGAQMDEIVQAERERATRRGRGIESGGEEKVPKAVVSGQWLVLSNQHSGLVSPQINPQALIY